MDDALFEKLTAGLKQGVEHARGERELRETVFPSPPPAVSAERVKAVRESVSLSQAKFAGVLGVRPKTVQSWEQGVRPPAPVACRMIEVLEQHPAMILKTVGLGETSRVVVLKTGGKTKRKAAKQAEKRSRTSAAGGSTTPRKRPVTGRAITGRKALAGLKKKPQAKSAAGGGG